MRLAINQIPSIPLNALSLGILLAFSHTASAVEYDVGDVSINFDSSFSFGGGYRTENRDFSLIGKNNQPGLDWSEYNLLSNPSYSANDVWAEDGAYSANGDLGNLNHDPQRFFSTLFKGTHELDINAGDYGFFTRFMYFYDDAAHEEKAWRHPLTNKQSRLCDDKEAQKQLCKDLRLLDAFIYADFTLGDDIPVSLRLGDQVVSWGESTLISHGINSINPVDIARLKAPGAELKEAFIPVGMLWGSVGLSENLSFDFYYQYEWEKTWLPAPGSYFSTNDFAGDGGYNNNIQLGFTANPDINADYLISDLNNQIAPYLKANASEISALQQIMADPNSSEQQRADAGAAFYQITAPYYAYGTKVAIKAPNNNVEPDDGGQYGLKFSYYSPELNDSEFSFYHMNYHSRRPLISGKASNFSISGLSQDIALLQNQAIDINNLNQLGVFTEGILEYPEDIKLYGLSFNTSIGETALAGEIAYRQDEPLQIDDVELLYEGMLQQLANAGLRTDLDNVSQVPGDTQAGQIAKGYIRTDTTQVQATITHLFGPNLLADSVAVLFEAGYVYIADMPAQDELRLNGPGTARSGPLAQAQGLHAGISNGPETNPFPTEDAWGYRFVTKLSYNNVFGLVNISPRLIFSHDVDGITPDPLFLFVEDRKSASLALNIDYQSSLSFDISYNAFWDGVGTTNTFADRDYLSFSLQYSL